MNVRIGLIGTVLILGTMVEAATFYKEKFQIGYTVGSLSGQNGWVSGAYSSTGSTVVEQGGNYFVSGAANSYSITDAGNFGLTSTNTITLMFDVYASAAGANAAFGIGNYNPASSSSGTPAVFGLQGGNWSIRGWGVGTVTLARNTSNIAIAATLDKWYRVKSVWDLSGTGTATLSIMNLTDGETEYTQLFFNAGQTTATADLGLGSTYNPGVANWEGGYLRTQNSQVDNMVVPKPSKISLFAVTGETGL